MNSMLAISKRTGRVAVISMLADLRRRISRKIWLELNGRIRTRLGRAHETQLGAYEKARISRYLVEVNSGRMSCEDAQQSIAKEWIRAYGPGERHRSAGPRTNRTQ
jgi:hypothetical protein